MPAPSSTAARSLWTRRMQRCAQASLSVAEACRREGFSVQSFYCWKLEAEARRVRPHARLCLRRGKAARRAGHRRPRGVYLGTPNQIFAACCNSYARQEFVEAKPHDPAAAAQAQAFYRGLYDVEGRSKDLSTADRLALRQSESVPLMGELHDWLVDKRNDPRVLPKVRLARRCVMR